MIDAVRIIESAIVSPGEHASVRRVSVQPTVDWLGHDALDVMIVLADDGLSGSEAITILTEIYEALQAAGDDRFPILHYATEEELALDDGSEP